MLFKVKKDERRLSEELREHIKLLWEIKNPEAQRNNPKEKIEEDIV
jgi:hypothetical protein